MAENRVMDDIIRKARTGEVDVSIVYRYLAELKDRDMELARMEGYDWAGPVADRLNRACEKALKLMLIANPETTRELGKIIAEMAADEEREANWVAKNAQGSENVVDKMQKRSRELSGIAAALLEPTGPVRNELEDNNVVGMSGLAAKPTKPEVRS